MKNVSNPETLDAALEELARDKNPKIGEWIKTVGKKWLLTEVAAFRRLTVTDLMREYRSKPWMLKAFPAGVLVYEFDPEDNDFQQFREDVDACTAYLLALQASGIKQLNTVKFDRAVTEGHRAIERTRVEERVTEKEEDKTLVHRYGNGYAWWDLKTAKALRNESAFMGHCVGNEGMSYTRRVEAGEIHIFSLRDGNDQPHATIEYDPETKHLKQLKGKANQGVVEKYRGACIGFIKGMIAKNEVRRVYLTDMERSNITGADLGIVFGPEGVIFRV